MQKRDTTGPISKELNEKEVCPPEENLAKASEEQLKARRVISIKGLKKKAPTEDKVTKGFFNLSDQNTKNSFTSFSGTLDLKPSTNSLAFFQGNNKTATESKETKPEDKKEEKPNGNTPEPKKGGLFANLNNASSNGPGLFSSLAKKEGGLFSSLGNASKPLGLFGAKSTSANGFGSFFKTKTGNNQEEDDEEEDDEQKQEEESEDESKVEMKYQYKEIYQKIIQKSVSNFKEQLVGAPAPEGGFGLGTITLEKLKEENSETEPKEGDKKEEEEQEVKEQKEKQEEKQEEKEKGEQPEYTMFVFRNKAKLVKHQSMIIKGVSSYKVMKARKEGMCLVTVKQEKDEADKTVLKKCLVKVLFNDEKELLEFETSLKALL
jgi:hypothetical protein